MASSPTDRGLLQFSMNIKGKYTKALKSLSLGDEVKARGPYGSFIYDTARDKNSVFIAGGIGITPFMSMVRYSKALNGQDKITLLYSCRDSKNIAFKDELLSFEKANPNFRVIFAISRGEIPESLRNEAVKGRISSRLIDQVTQGHAPAYRYFICGPKGFMASMATMLDTKGIDRKNIVTEAFSQGNIKQTDLLKSWPFNVYILTAASVVLIGAVIMAYDLVKTLPGIVNSQAKAVNPASNASNSRQTQIDQTINNLQNQQNSSGSNTTNSSSSSAGSSAASQQPGSSPPTTSAPACASTPSKPC
jgi:ferredoxin-NADP reductase